MLRSFQANTADETWLQISAALREDLGVCEQESRCGNTKEILHAVISIENPTSRWVTSRTPAINPAYAFAELIWTLAGRNDSAFVNFFNSKLPKMAGSGLTYHGAYGERLRKHLGFDQLARAYFALRNCPDSRQVVLQIWDSTIDLPNNAGAPVSQDIPCNLVSLLKIRSGQLEWTQVMRSNDIFRGIPYDFVQFTCLQEIFAGWLDVKSGSYFHVSDSLHAYVDDIPNILASTPVVLDADSSCLALSFEESGEVFRVLSRAVDEIVDLNVSSARLLSNLKGTMVRGTYKDMLAVLTAEGLRKRKEEPASLEALHFCDNSLFRQLWSRWRDRWIVSSK